MLDSWIINILIQMLTSLNRLKKWVKRQVIILFISIENGLGYIGGIVAMLSYTLPYTFDSVLLDELYFKGSCLGIGLVILKLFLVDKTKFRSLLFVVAMFFLSVFVMTTVNFIADQIYGTRIGVELVMSLSVLCVTILLMFYVFRWK